MFYVFPYYFDRPLIIRRPMSKECTTRRRPSIRPTSRGQPSVHASAHDANVSVLWHDAPWRCVWTSHPGWFVFSQAGFGMGGRVGLVLFGKWYFFFLLF